MMIFIRKCFKKPSIILERSRQRLSVFGSKGSEEPASFLADLITGSSNRLFQAFREWQEVASIKKNPDQFQSMDEARMARLERLQAQSDAVSSYFILFELDFLSIYRFRPLKSKLNAMLNWQKFVKSASMPHEKMVAVKSRWRDGKKLKRKIILLQ